MLNEKIKERHLKTVTWRPEGKCISQKEKAELAADGKKWCPACEKVLDIGEFGKRKCAKDGLTQYCRKCYRECHKKSQKKKGSCKNRYKAHWKTHNPYTDPDIEGNFKPTKVCSGCPKHGVCCGRELPLEEFATRASSKDGLQHACKGCHRMRVRMYKYTITQVQAFLLHKIGLCFVCRMFIHEDGHLDHDHTTGEPRGHLCPGCNTAEPYVTKFFERGEIDKIGHLKTTWVDYLTDNKWTKFLNLIKNGFYDKDMNDPKFCDMASVLEEYKKIRGEPQ